MKASLPANGVSPSASASICMTVVSAPSWTGKAPGFRSDFIFRAKAFAAVDEGLFTGERRQPFGEREHLHDGGIGPVLDGESAWFLDVTDDVDLADFGNADFFAAGQ